MNATMTSMGSKTALLFNANKIVTAHHNHIVQNGYKNKRKTKHTMIYRKRKKPGTLYTHVHLNTIHTKLTTSHSYGTLNAQTSLILLFYTCNTYKHTYTHTDTFLDSWVATSSIISFDHIRIKGEPVLMAVSFGFV